MRQFFVTKLTHIVLKFEQVCEEVDKEVSPLVRVGSEQDLCFLEVSGLDLSCQLDFAMPGKWMCRRVKP